MNLHWRRYAIYCNCICAGISIMLVLRGIMMEVETANPQSFWEAFSPFLKVIPIALCIYFISSVCIQWWITICKLISMYIHHVNIAYLSFYPFLIDRYDNSIQIHLNPFNFHINLTSYKYLYEESCEENRNICVKFYNTASNIFMIYGLLCFLLIIAFPILGWGLMALFLFQYCWQHIGSHPFHENGMFFYKNMSDDFAYAFWLAAIESQEVPKENIYEILSKYNFIEKDNGSYYRNKRDTYVMLDSLTDKKEYPGLQEALLHAVNVLEMEYQDGFERSRQYNENFVFLYAFFLYTKSYDKEKCRQARNYLLCEDIIDKDFFAYQFGFRKLDALFNRYCGMEEKLHAIRNYEFNASVFQDHSLYNRTSKFKDRMGKCYLVMEDRNELESKYKL